MTVIERRECVCGYVFSENECTSNCPHRFIRGGEHYRVKVEYVPAEQLQGAVKSLQEIRDLLYNRGSTPRRGTLPAIKRIDEAIDSLIGGQ